jgi:dTDP-4-amino-4,6-dideoxygalactose transaminase
VLGIGPGDEVITTPNSAFATALAVVRAGATPVFVDIEDRTCAMDASKVEAAVTPKTKALLPVHIYGQACDLDPLLDIAKRRGLWLVNDAAQAHGAKYKGQDVATYGDATCFSFYPTKNLGAFGDGGAVTFPDETHTAKARSLRDYGQSKKYLHTELGLNSRLDELHAAMLRAMLKHLPAHTERRVAIARRYRERLSGAPVTLLEDRGAGTSVHHLFVVRTPKRDLLMAHLKERGIQSAVHYPTVLPLQPALASLGNKPGAFPVAERAAAEYLSLPIHPVLADAEVDAVATAVHEFFRA